MTQVNVTPIKKVLIANRGEIACRIIRTLKKLDIDSVALYSDADKTSQHVSLADEAVYIGPSPAAESYLCADKIIAAAKRTGANAIHPGYGFLSENSNFARTCDENGIIFIGPPTSAIDAMGSKAAAKDIMEKAEVPLVPGYHEEDQSDARLLEEAKKIGFPVLLKAALGGGGKGMRLVESAEEFQENLDSCKREAIASFGDDFMLIEKYINEPRHVEIQVFCDQLGNGVYLFERDCSIQRRHQKVIEEAPAPGLSEELRKTMGDTAVRAAKSINYVGAGTFEFLMDADGSFYFMEMNTRLQVEHPVTEKITGQDLVEWQIRAAEGHPLPCEQSELTRNGHAIEVRIYAETPENEFLPSTGKIQYLRTPEENDHVRIDSGVVQGDEVSVYYDPMIAKLIVWDKTRSGAIHRMDKALQEYCVDGVNTNTEFLSNINSNADFINGKLSTHFIEHHNESLLALDKPINDIHFIYAALYQHLQSGLSNASNVALDQQSPWSNVQGWTMNSTANRSFRFTFEDEINHVSLAFNANTITASCNDTTINCEAYLDGDKLTVITEQAQQLYVNQVESLITLFIQGKAYKVTAYSAEYASGDDDNNGQLTAPMNGRIVDVFVKTGESVELDQPLAILEAMKMEHTIRAPAAGIISEVFYSPGDLIDDGAPLLAFEAEDEE
ncbi:3-methylcrotonyl-CoA carboxylase [Gammaproteobacteria bacterium 45_16_T64]|nr:3-methylcrotonyl-CoA carboxylase [Gammaproteobacteria bacterium 45_16_T64]